MRIKGKGKMAYYMTNKHNNNKQTNKQTNVERKERDKRGEGREERTKNGIKHCKEKNEKI